MWVWQSQASAGTSKFTAVAGWAALAWLALVRIRPPAHIAPISASRRVSMVSSAMGSRAARAHPCLDVGAGTYLVFSVPLRMSLSNAAGNGLRAATGRTRYAFQQRRYLTQPAAPGVRRKP